MRIASQARTGTLKMIIMTISFVVLTDLVRAFQTEAKWYPYADEYFDKIYKITDGDKPKYLHIYCKEKNMLSISITKEI